MSNSAIYLDHNATAPLCPEAAAAMRPWMEPIPANPSAVHRSGQRARAAIEMARDQVASVCGPDSEVIFTSSGTEADNLALWGVLGWPPQGHLIVSAIEHPAILEPARALEALGVAVTVVPVDRQGRVDADAVEAAITDETRLISVMAANNEVGTLQPVARIAEIGRARDVPVHCDAVQALAWLPLLEHTGDVDLLTLAAHKIGGPVGIGALVLRRPLPLEPLLRGGGQQRGRRPGTEAVALALGFGAACERVASRRDTEAVRIAALTERLGNRCGLIADVEATVDGAPTLPNTLHLSIGGADGATLVARLDLEGLAVSGGSACASGVARGSHVLEAMGIDARAGRGVLRISLGYDTTSAQIDRAAGILETAIAAVRAASAPQEA